MVSHIRALQTLCKAARSTTCAATWICLVTLSLASPLLAQEDLPSFTTVRARHAPSDVSVLDRHGQSLGRIRSNFKTRTGQWLGLEQVSPALRTAIVYSEDRRFYEHSGVDWSAVGAAAWGNLWNSKTRGASTLTMQLAGLIEKGYAAEAGRRSWWQKLGQAGYATQLEKRWRKDQILEAYLNLAPFRGEVVGVDAMSRTLFSKAAHGLDEREAAVAAALLRAPSASGKVVSQRACQILKNLPQNQGQKSSTLCRNLDVFVDIVFARAKNPATTPIANEAPLAPHAARFAMSQNKKMAVDINTNINKNSQAHTNATLRLTLDKNLQSFANQTLLRFIKELQGRNVQDGAVLVLDNQSGEVLAWVGSSGRLSEAGQVDAVLAQRQAGSTLKPFLYAHALDKKMLTAASLLDDSPAQIPTVSGLYIPKNYDLSYQGWTSMRFALGGSLNIPAVRTLVMVTPELFAKTLAGVGLNLPKTAGHYGYSLALGSAEVRLLDLTNAYRVLANGGIYSPVRLQSAAAPSAASKRQALSAQASFVISDILADRYARVSTFGLSNVLNTRFWSAVKTGTSKDMRDNWAVGYSQKYTVGVWVGNASGEPMWGVSGTSGAAPIWAQVMQYLHKNSATQASAAPASPATPRGLLRSKVVFEDGLEASRSEWFFSGTQTSFVRRAGSHTNGTNGTNGTNRTNHANRSSEELDQTLLRITSPANHSTVALDPDIPPSKQRLHFRSSAKPQQAGAARLEWRIDGQRHAKGAHFAWLPWPGRHTVSLHTAEGKLLDSIQLEVRGAGVR